MTGRTPFRRSAAFAVFLTAVLGSCRNVDVTAVDVGTVDVVPDAATLFIGQSRDLEAHVMSGTGTPIDRPVAWMSSDPERVSIDDNGRITAHRSGTVTITARSGGVTGTAQIEVRGFFTFIDLSMSGVSFAVQHTAPGPPAQQVDVRSQGNGPLDGLSSSVAYTAGQPGGWLTASLNGTTAPTTLRVAVQSSSLPPGTYAATVRVASPVAGNSPALVSVSLDVESAPAITLSETAVTLHSEEGSRKTEKHTIAVGASGSGVLNELKPGISYAAGQSGGWLSAKLDSAEAPTVLTLEASARQLSEGTYHATVSIQSSSASNSPQAIAVTFLVDDD